MATPVEWPATFVPRETSMTDIPFKRCPIRERDGIWEVGGIAGVDIDTWLACDSKTHAIAVADCCIFQKVAESGQPYACDPDRVQRCLDALAQAGLDHNALISRMVLDCLDKPD